MPCIALSDSLVQQEISKRVVVLPFYQRYWLTRGSKMDEVIYEEFKGTGNMEVHLDRKIAEKRTFPSININRSGTRREELITKEDELMKMWILRKILHPMTECDAIEFLLERLKRSKTNEAFFEDMKGKD